MRRKRGGDKVQMDTKEHAAPWASEGLQGIFSLGSKIVKCVETEVFIRQPGLGGSHRFDLMAFQRN